MDVITVLPYVSHLLTEFHWLIDNGFNEKVADLFAEDAVVEAPGIKLTGHNEISHFYSDQIRFRSVTTRHYWSNLRVTVAGEVIVAEANMMTIFQNMSSEAKPIMFRAGHLKDKILFGGIESKFVYRRLVIQFEGPIAESKRVATGYTA
jgi:ketosteroid isomerase-like protein